MNVNTDKTCILQETHTIAPQNEYFYNLHQRKTSLKTPLNVTLSLYDWSAVSEN